MVEESHSIYLTQSQGATALRNPARAIALIGPGSAEEMSGSFPSGVLESRRGSYVDGLRRELVGQIGASS